MLKKISLIFLFIFAFPALACFRVEGKLAVDGENFPLNQKAEASKEYSLPMGSYIFSFTLHPVPKKENEFNLKYKLEERKASKLEMVTDGEEEVMVGKSHKIYAKGLEKRPHSIINLKVIDI